MKLLNDENGFGRLWLSSLTATQLSSVLDYLAAKGRSQISAEMADLRAAASAPPLFGFLDIGTSVEAEKLWYLTANWLPFIITDWLASDMDVPDYYEIFVKGAGVEPALAHKLAEDVVTPDGAVANFARRAISAITNLPIIHDIQLLQQLGDVAAESAATIIESVGARHNGHDNTYEGILAGQKMLEMKLRAATMVGAYAFEGAIHGKGGAPSLEGGNPFHDASGTVYGLDESGNPYTVGTSIYDAIGLNRQNDEDGNPMEPDIERIAAARDALSKWLDDVHAAKITGMHAYAAAHPEEGGFFGSLWKGIKKAAKGVASFASSVIPGVAPILGAVNAVGGLLSSGSKNPRPRGPALLSAYNAIGGGGRHYSPQTAGMRPSQITVNPDDLIRVVSETLRARLG